LPPALAGGYGSIYSKGFSPNWKKDHSEVALAKALRNDLFI
jgi:hypothetical protein